MTKIGNLIVLLFIFSASNVHAQIVVQAELLTDKIGVGQYVNLELRISSPGDVKIEETMAPGFEGLQVRNTNQSTQISTRMQSGANGMEYSTQKTTTFTYRLQAVAAGKKAIKPFVVVVDGKEYKTESIPITISAKPVHQPHSDPTENGMGGNEDDPFSQMDKLEEMFKQLMRGRNLPAPQGGPQGQPQEDENPALLKEPAYRSTPSNNNEAFFIQVEVDKTEVYEGEQIVVSWYLVTRGQLESLDRTNSQT